MGCVPFINEFNIMKWFLHFRNFITEVRHILQNVILSLLQLQYSTFTQYFFFFFLYFQRNITFFLFLHLLVEMGSTGNGNYYYFSHYIRILLCNSCWPYDQPFFGETLLGFAV